MINKGFRKILIIGAAIITVGSIISGVLFGWGAFALFLLLGIGLLAVFLFYTHKRYKELNRINDYLSKVLTGEYDLAIGNNEEGEISILQNNIYKTTVQLREQNELLDKEKVYLVEMLANITHQIKTPLTSMMMMNELLAKEESSEKRQEFIEIEKQQLDKLNWLIQNLLKLSKLDAGTIKLKQENTSVSKLLEECVSPFLIQMDVEEIHLNMNIKECMINVDYNWTVEAIGNIVKNCIEHMDNNGILEITNEDTKLYHAITVKDNGCGIAQEDLPHIFERFYKGKEAKKDSVGIGLALAKTIIEKERGEILVKSTLGKGTVFEIRFYKSVI